jgi:MFS family permease
VLGPLFDKIGRRKMISRTYFWPGLLLVVSAFVFNTGGFTAMTQTLVWCVIFFFASAGASSAYLTVSEIFPMEVRAKAIAVFFAIAQCFGALGTVTYGRLAENPDLSWLFGGYLAAAAMMIAGGVVARLIAVDAENRPLEEVATPLSVITTERYPNDPLDTP